VGRIRARLERRTGSTEQRIREAIAVANNEIFRAAQSNKEWEGMACVLTVAVLENGSAVIGHVGDSRLYEIRRGGIRKLTHDHSPVGEREDNGELQEAEAMRHPRRNEVFRDVGSEEHAPDDPDFIETLTIPFEPDSALLLCSDGLSDLVPSAEIRRAVERHAGDPDAAARALIAAANSAGGKDNVTVVLVEGEQFAAQADASPAPVRTGVLASRPLWFACGLLLAAAGAWFSRDFWVPDPAVVPPAVIEAGNGAELTIADALAKARPGDTVEVRAGEYREPIRLKSGVAVRSQTPGAAILRAAAAGSEPAVAADGITGARISGFRILADAEAPLAVGVVLVNSTVDVDDLEVAGAGVGIEIRGGQVMLRANTVRDCAGEGVLVQGASPWLSHNSIQRNKIGLAARDGARPALMGNVFEKNTVEMPPDISLDDVRAHNFFLDGPLPQRRVRPAATKAQPAGEAKQ
jgi:serine/threonine protein phosphatase PrpC